MRKKLMIGVSVVLWLVVGTAFCQADTLLVPQQYPTIQAAINAANNNDTVLVNNGTYYENINFLGKAITVRSVNGPNVTVINGNQNGSVVTFQNREGPNSILDGFTITNGSGTYYSGPFGYGYCGGGIIVLPWGVVGAGPTIMNNVITGNSVTGAGGGIFGDEIYVIIRHNTITNNSAGIDGAGIYLVDVRPGMTVTIEENTFTSNTAAGSGGGMNLVWVYGNANIRANTVTLNTANGSGGGMLIGGIGGVAYATIENNTIHMNTASSGGGIYCSINASISHNTISENGATSGSSFGGGIYASIGNGLISNNKIINNSASRPNYNQGAGGGIYCTGGAPTISNNTIVENFAFAEGGGIYGWNSSAVVDGNFISKNSTDLNYNFTYGGGIYWSNSNNPNPIIKNNIISENTSVYGGGIETFASSLQIINNIIYRNSAVQNGGGLSLSNGTIFLTNNTTTSNTAGNWGGGLFCGGFGGNVTTTGANSILWNNSAQQGPEIALGWGSLPVTLTISYSDVQGGQSQVYIDPYSTVILNWGSGMIDIDPLFADIADKDFHLTFNSPCKDVGNRNDLNLPTTDFEGDPRILSPIDPVSMGADEYHRHLYHTGNATPGGNIKIKIVGTPLTSPTNLAYSANILNPPLSTPFGNLYLQWPIYLFDLGSIPANGILSFPITIPPQTNPGTQFPLQAVVVEPLSNPSLQLTNLEVITIE